MKQDHVIDSEEFIQKIEEKYLLIVLYLCTNLYVKHIWLSHEMKTPLLQKKFKSYLSKNLKIGGNFRSLLP